jgi:hypothetical protein
VWLAGRQHRDVDAVALEVAPRAGQDSRNVAPDLAKLFLRVG